MKEFSSEASHGSFHYFLALTYAKELSKFNRGSSFSAPTYPLLGVSGLGFPLRRVPWAAQNIYTLSDVYLT